jgi:hypothetical protein
MQRLDRRRFVSSTLAATDLWCGGLRAAAPGKPRKYPDIDIHVHVGLYGDLSEPGGYWAIHRDETFGREFLIRRADRLLFRTDFLMADQEVPQFELLDLLNLLDPVQAKIYRQNAMRLLKL